MATNGRGSSKSGTATKAGSTATTKRRPMRSRAAGDTSRAAPAAPAKSDAPVVEVAVEDPVVETGGTDQALAASETDLAKLQAARRAKLIKAVALSAIALVLITFVMQNARPVGVRILPWTVSIRLIWVIVGSALLGAVGGYLVGRPDKHLLLHGPNRRQDDDL